MKKMECDICKVVTEKGNCLLHSVKVGFCLNPLMLPDVWIDWNDILTSLVEISISFHIDFCPTIKRQIIVLL